MATDEAANLEVTAGSNGAAANPFYVEQPFGALLAQAYGTPMSPEVQAAWAQYLVESEAAEHRRTLLGLVDVADVMEDGSTEPKMLTDMLVAGLHHLIFGTKAASKTWLLFVAVRDLMNRGCVVVWVDKEMGRTLIADRLVSLGVSPDVVREQFVYCEYPTMDGSKDSVALWALLLAHRQPVLVVVDAQTEVLADANLNENLGTDIERWMKWYLTPARRAGIATVMIDHTGHDTQGRAVSSRQKGAAAKVELEVEKVDDFDRDTVGMVKVWLRKNTASAPIPKVQTFRIGGTPFVCEPAFDLSAGAESPAYLETLADTRAVLAKHGKLVTSQVEKMVPHKSALVRKALLELVRLEEAKPEPGGNNSVAYVWLAEAQTQPASVRPSGVETYPPDERDEPDGNERTQRDEPGTNRIDTPGTNRTQRDEPHAPQRDEPKTERSATAAQKDGCVTRICDHCGNEFETKIAGGGASRATYCGSSCRGKARRAREKAGA